MAFSSTPISANLSLVEGLRNPKFCHVVGILAARIRTVAGLHEGLAELRL